jgi:hypothetical protein
MNGVATPFAGRFIERLYGRALQHIMHDPHSLPGTS